MKKLFISILFAGLAAFAVANPVSFKHAKQVALGAAYLMYLEQNPTMQKQPLMVTAEFDARISPYNNIYVFNMYYTVNDEAVDNGFVVVSGDMIAAPILAFSNEGKLDYENLNPAARAMFDRYDKQIAAAKAKGAESSPAVSQKWEKLESIKNAEDATAMMAKGDINNDNISRLLGGMRWNQGKPYNEKCPGGSVTGCVATAFGMIMNYWDYPVHGFGRHSYNGLDNPAAYPNWTYGEQSADFENTYYDWEHMADYVMINSDDAEIEAVSTLVYQIGVSLDMHYTPEGSGCWSLPEYAIFDTSLHLSPNIGADTRIPRHFGYKFSYAGMRDSIGNDSIWLNMLYTSLAEGKPIYYAGWAVEDNEAGHSGTSGHGYILDGFFSDEVDSNLFHINWGWGGSSDGFFKLDAMTPTQYDFTQWHGAIIGIEPDTSYHGYDMSGIRPTENTNIRIYANTGRIQVNGCQNSTIAVYDLMGRTIATRGSRNADEWSLTAKPGVYVVRVGHQPGKKVIVF